MNSKKKHVCVPYLLADKVCSINLARGYLLIWLSFYKKKSRTKLV